MTPHVIVSYDDTENDRDALALGRVLHDLGAQLTLAYIRHAAETPAEREQLAAAEAEMRLEHGATLIGDPSIERRVVLSPSTGDGLSRLAVELDADVIVLGSEYRTPHGHVAAGRSAQLLLENGPTAVALAPAGYADRAHGRPERIAVLPGSADEAALETAHALAARHDGAVLDTTREVDLLVVGSRREAREGRVMVTASAARAIEEATAPVLVLARGVSLRFGSLVAA